MSGQAAVDLWESFRQYLHLEIVYGEPPALTLTITNTAPVSDDSPRIVFEDLSVTPTAVSGRQTSNRIRNLAPGNSAEIEYTATDPALVRFEVTGTVSRREFFQIRRAVDAPDELTRPLVEEYLSTLEAVRVLDRADEAREALLGIGSDTTLGELEQLKDRLAASTEALRAVRPCKVPRVESRVVDSIRDFTAPITASARHAVEALETRDLGDLKQDQDRVRDLVSPLVEYTRVVEGIRAEYGLTAS